MDEEAQLPFESKHSEKGAALTVADRESSTTTAQAEEELENDNNNNDDNARVPRWRLTLVISSLWIGTLLVAIDTTIISVAIPHIATEFRAFEHVGWYGSAYLFTVTAFQPAFGSVFRLFDAKWTYLASVVVFEGAFSSPILFPFKSANILQSDRSSALLRQFRRSSSSAAPCKELERPACTRQPWPSLGSLYRRRRDQWPSARS